MKTPFLWLGANRARKWPVGDKARLLDKAASAGLPVPPGGILLDELFALLINEGVVTEREGVVTAVSDSWLAETLYEGVHFPRLTVPVIIRAAFSLAGAPQLADPLFAPQRAVQPTDPAQLAQALCRVWSSARGPASLRRDVLLTEMVGVEMPGTAVTGGHAPDHVTCHPPGTAPTALELPWPGRFARPDSSLPPYARRLQLLLRGARRTFGAGSWQVDWLDDGRICWLIQIYPHG